MNRKGNMRTHAHAWLCRQALELRRIEYIFIYHDIFLYIKCIYDIYLYIKHYERKGNVHTDAHMTVPPGPARARARRPVGRCAAWHCSVPRRLKTNNFIILFYFTVPGPAAQARPRPGNCQYDWFVDDNSEIQFKTAIIWSNHSHYDARSWSCYNCYNYNCYNYNNCNYNIITPGPGAVIIVIIIIVIIITIVIITL